MAVLKLTKRDRLGTRAARRLRQQDMIPGIIYGHGEANTAVGIPRHDIELVVQHGQRLIQAELGGEEQNVFVKDVQYDHLGQTVLHVDLTRVRLDERVKVTVPVVLRGTAVGVESENGVLTQYLNEIECECLVTEIPDELPAMVTDLHVGDMLRVADFQLAEGVRVLSEPAVVVASVTVVAEEEEAPAPEEAEAAAEPEVVGEKPEPEAGAEEADAEKRKEGR